MSGFVDSLLIPGVTRAHVSEIGSTNTEALARAASGATGPLWITADRQTSGRARSGRSWSSPEGNLIASLLVTLPCSPAVAHHLGLLAGVALFDAMGDIGVHSTPASPLVLKWPNDVLIGGAKASGILAESTTLRAGQLTAVIGFGVNVLHSPTDLDRATTTLSRHMIAGHPVPTADSLLWHLALRTQQWLSTWNCGTGFDEVRSAWLARAIQQGTPLSVNAGDQPRHGVFAGLDTDGALLLDDEHCVRHRITYGDVTLNAAPRVV
jgi:BirA family transcriptional regulator, biotin operon repressor / biotin---[acetyl-CoA-carboxylase] ligase